MSLRFCYKEIHSISLVYDTADLQGFYIHLLPHSVSYQL